ncbi:hypothetical protein BpHYR1_002030 [Brachionus plicatilis]|uniref:Uncharacterized protein n=1 Tax=Brachionus plicatilis TaxID=10195 RepID=A0A3M7RBJ3_BRAPC|nr:hypothetical protein BpHYR1_002030 [Brachionus plicatilis]
MKMNQKGKMNADFDLIILSIKNRNFKLPPKVGILMRDFSYHLNNHKLSEPELNKNIFVHSSIKITIISKLSIPGTIQLDFCKFLQKTFANLAILFKRIFLSYNYLFGIFLAEDFFGLRLKKNFKHPK